MTRLDISDFHPAQHGLGLWQNHIERILAGWVGELEVPIHRGRGSDEVSRRTTRASTSSCPTAARSGRIPRRLRRRTQSGRRTASIEFPGWDPTTSSLIAEVEMAEEPELGIRHTSTGTHALGKVEYEIRDGEVVYKDGGTVGVMLTEAHVGATTEPTLHDLSEGSSPYTGPMPRIHSPTFLSRFTDMTRQAAAYRDGRGPAGRRRRTCIPRWVDRVSTPVCRTR